MQQSAKLEQTMSSAERRVKDVFCGYYLIIDEDAGEYTGLYTGMLARLVR